MSKDEPKFKVEITIPASVYKDWGSFHGGGEDEVRAELKRDFRDALLGMRISGYELEITHEQ